MSVSQLLGMPAILNAAQGVGILQWIVFVHVACSGGSEYGAFARDFCGPSDMTGADTHADRCRKIWSCAGRVRGPTIDSGSDQGQF